MTTEHDPTPNEALGGGHAKPAERTEVATPDAAGEAPVSEHAGSEAPAAGGSPETATGEAPLADRNRQWTDRWNEIQTMFVDEPRQSVERAHALVDEVVNEFTAALARERSRLEIEWNAGQEPSTEDLRATLQHYRSLFQRLLAAT